MYSKPFDLNSIINPLARRPGLIDLRGHRIALPGVSSHEPLLRGCNQREWLERLVAMGIRHLVVPLNGLEEDTCLFARRHPYRGDEKAKPSTTAPGGGNDVLYDLEHRDEGFFARLQFLLDAAGELGVMTGLSLFGLRHAHAGPLRPNANLQGIALEETGAGGLEIHPETAPGVQSVSKIESVLFHAAGWIAAEIRSRDAVWIEAFRDREILRSSLQRRVEIALARRLDDALGKPGESAQKLHAGPWVLPPQEPGTKEIHVNHPAPFLSWHGHYSSIGTRPGETASGESADRIRDPIATPARPQTAHGHPGKSGEDTDSINLAGEMTGGLAKSELKLASFRADPRRAAIHQCAFVLPADSDRFGLLLRRARSSLWRTALRGCWPVVAGGFDESKPSCWTYLVQLSAFANQWVTHGYLRACPELLAPMTTLAPQIESSERMTAATDGCGRYFVYCNEYVCTGLTLETPPGAYRFYWFDPITGQGYDRGAGLDGGTHCRVPGPRDTIESILILEQEELPDPFSVW